MPSRPTGTFTSKIRCQLYSSTRNPPSSGPKEMEAAAADYLKLQDLYEQKEALEEEILKLYGKWEDLSAQLEEARG